MPSSTASAAWLSLDGLSEGEDGASKVGRKALSLADMRRAGLPVPEATALTTALYQHALASPALAPAVAQATAHPGAEAFATVREALKSAPLPESVEAAIVEAYRALGGGPVAVRSSGTAEDMAGASFAGMYETLLNVEGAANVVTAVRRCWASAWSERVAAYAEKKGIDRAAMAMGVVLQRQVAAEVSGVLFTLDPTSGLEDRMRAEACFGLGEALVSGHVQPDQFVLDRRSGSAVEATIAEKAFRLVATGGEVVREELDDSMARRPTLDAPQLAELAALGRRVQAYYGAPQDIEWVLEGARLYLVQSRPITTIHYAGVTDEWTTADFKDGGVSARVCSPYMWSLYDSIWQHAMPTYLRGIKLLRHDDPVVWGRVFYGRPYWNCGEVKRCLHLVPGFNERNFDRDLGIEGAYAGDGVVIPTNVKTIANALPVLFALEADYKARLKTNRRFVDGWVALEAPYAQDPAGLDDAALGERYRKLVVEDYFRTETTYFFTIYNTSNAKLDFKVELDKANKHLTEPLSYLNLLSGLQDMRHLDPLKALWELAGEIRRDEALTARVLETPAEALQDALLAGAHAGLWAKLAEFLHRYRHHGVAELDITQPRWNEDPAWVLSTLKTYVSGYDPARSPDALNAKQHALYQAERARAEAYFAGKGLLGRFAARGFFGKLELLRTYSWWREELRDHSSRMYALLRRETLAVARSLSRRGLLDAPEDVWYLTFRDVLAVLDGALSADDARRLVAERREYNEGFRNFTNPNELGQRYVVGGAPKVSEAPDGALCGIPCSPGVVKARVRVIRTIQEGHRLQPGELLVTQFTDPGWTPLFSHIAGVVTETGGILSHAAVIAREYGIPAVLAVPGATRALRDGQWVIVDGSAGTVTPVEGPPDGPDDASDHDEPGTLTTTIPAAAPSDAPGDDVQAYADHARPKLARLMRALGLDVTYDWAQGDRMRYPWHGARREVVDMLGGYGATLFGHHHPALAGAWRDALDAHAPVQAQASWRAGAGKLAKALSDRIGADTGAQYVVTLGNSGAEAIEAALKHAELERREDATAAARRFSRRARSFLACNADWAPFLAAASEALGRDFDGPQGALDALEAANAAAADEPPVFLALDRAFHGKTSGATQLTHNPAYRTPFTRLGVKSRFLSASDTDAWERAIAEAARPTYELGSEGGRPALVRRETTVVAAILVEPIQGEGGIHPLSSEDAARLRSLADRLGVPLVVDEIQSGLGRTGHFLAATGCGLVGDYYSFAKSLGGGLAKIGALAIDRRRYREDFGVWHTSTFAEDEPSCRVALEALALVEREDVPGRARRLGDMLLAGLRGLVAKHPSVLAEARGRGLMLGLAFRAQQDNPSNVIRMLDANGYLGWALAGYLLHEEGFRVAPTLSQASTLRIEPSAFLDPLEVERFVRAIDRLCTVVERANAYRLTRYLVGLADPAEDAPVEDFTAASGGLRREAPVATAARVAFVGHFISARDALLWDPSLTRLPADAVKRYQLAAHRVLGPTIYDQWNVTSATGEPVHLSFIGLNVTSKSIEAAMRTRDTAWLVELVSSAVEIARDAGCQVVGLGGYTSIVTDNGRKLDVPGVALTTGNSLTVAMGLAALERGAAERGVPIESACLGIVGAAGNIGSVYARLVARRVPRLVLVGREGGSRLARVAQRVYLDALERLADGVVPTGLSAAIAQTRAVATALAVPREDWGDRLAEQLAADLAAELGEGAPIVLSSDPAALSACRLILSASNSAAPVIRAEHLHPGPVVICDVSVPADVADDVEATRPDVLVVRGGLVAVPNAPAFRIGGIPLPEGHAFACMSETMLLGLEGATEHYSYGPVRPEQVDQAMAWAVRHGFMLGDYKRDRSF